MARPRKSVALKVVEGNAGRRNAGAAVAFVSDEVPPPIWLEGEVALTEWHRVTKELKTAGRLSLVDQAAVAVYCDAYARYQQASERLRKEGLTVFGEKGGEYPHPALRALNDAARIMSKAQSEFGFTTAAREKLAPAAPPVDPKRAKFFGS